MVGKLINKIAEKAQRKVSWKQKQKVFSVGTIENRYAADVEMIAIGAF